jgi:hypothetical protein
MDAQNAIGAAMPAFSQNSPSLMFDIKHLP